MAFANILEAAPSDSGGVATSHPISYPTTVNEGDLLVLIFNMRGTTEPVITWPSGWDQPHQVIFPQQFNVRTTLTARYRVADGTEGGGTFTPTTDQNNVSRRNLYRFEAGTWGIPLCSSANTGADSSPDAPSFSPYLGARDYVWLPFYGGDVVAGGRNNVTIPTDYTDEVEASPTSGVCCSARRLLNAATEDPGVFGVNNSVNWICAVMAIPDPYGPPPFRRPALRNPLIGR